MEYSEDMETRLLLQPWASVCFAESTLLAKAYFGDAGYALLLCDLHHMWYERTDTQIIQQRSKDLNKRLTAHASSFLNRLRSLMCPLLEGQPTSSTSFSCELSPSTLTLHVKSEFSGLPFYWDFCCSVAPAEMISRHLVRPLMAMSLALQSQVQELASLLLRKDAEIEDYQESGAALSRERLKTEPFKEESFLQRFEDKTLPEACCLGDGHKFTSSLKKLYMAVTQHQARVACKRHSEASGDPESLERISTQDLSIEPEPEEGEAECQSTAAQCVQGTLASCTQAQKPQVPMTKTKRKKAKGLFS
ncbi:non-homologous end-joining factor 1 isoform X2 [Heteronotia binoei]|uniref:non-homologous end-joining factor 1 isoform X2 n=1 Tax=Heteronotia binoei TaxID=13085 RepID=UPI00292DDECB|nr:non-homologous end-joining factor 1 isoform X2 [Heteronotia binoei]XP_060117273.1 non-homologous end-joining factor 1 isoform X2 [Heteronotia binoei]